MLTLRQVIPAFLKTIGIMNAQNANNPSQNESKETGNKLVLFILGLSSVMGGVLALAVLQMGIPVHPSAMAAPQEHYQETAGNSGTHATGNTAVPASAAPTFVVPLNSFVVSLNEPGEQRYLKITLAVEVSSKATRTEVQQRHTELRDTLIPYFSGLSLDMTKGVRGKQRIRHQAANQMNTVLTTGTVNRVFISEFITQ